MTPKTPVGLDLTSPIAVDWRPGEVWQAAARPGHIIDVNSDVRQQGATVNFNNILIGSEDPKRLTDYYSGLFGKPAMEEGGYAGWQIGTGFVAVGPHTEVKGKNAHPGRLLWNIESADVQGDFARLKAAGAIVVREPYNPGDPGGPDMLIATFADPDDNYFQLQSPWRPAE